MVALMVNRELSSDGAALVNPNRPALAASTPYAPPPGEQGGDATGLRLFEGACASCHGWSAEGLQTPYGALRGSQTVNDPQATNLVQVILRGSAMTTAAARVSMPAFGAAYSDADIAAVSNYVLAHFGGKAPSVTPARVAKAGTTEE